MTGWVELPDWSVLEPGDAVRLERVDAVTGEARVLVTLIQSVEMTVWPDVVEFAVLVEGHRLRQVDGWRVFREVRR